MRRYGTPAAVPPALICACFALLATLSPLRAQTVDGTAYEDRNGDGIHEAGEPPLSGVQILLFGKTASSVPVSLSTSTNASGSFQFAPGNGCYVLGPVDPSGWRRTDTRADLYPSSTPGYTFPVGEPRFSKLDHAIGALQGGSLRMAAMGDSIMRNFNVCQLPAAFTYSKTIQSRLQCAAPSASITLDQAAVLGEHTDDLLVDDTADLNNVFRAIDDQPGMILLSMIGNDLLDVDPGSSPTQAAVNKAAAEILDGRQNLQEALSVMTTQIPSADIVVQTLYDNLAYNCATGNSTTFHREWLPIVDRILRDVAWGLPRRASVAEVSSDFAQEDLTNVCTGFSGMICRDLFGLDNIHPTTNGYQIVREKVWDSIGGASLGSGDVLGRTSLPAVDHGFLRLVRRLSPGRWELRNGAAVTTPEAALDGQDGGAAAHITLGAGAEEFRLSGFPDWYDEIQIVRVIAGVRYRTTGMVADDFYRMEASVNDQFRPPPGFSYSSTNWNWYTPIVGGGGPNQPPENPDYPTEKLLAVPNVPSYREVTATLTKNPVLAPGGASLAWPPLTPLDLATTTVRVASAPVAGTSGNDGYAIDLDNAWLDLYGWEKPRPAEVAGVRVDRIPDGSLVFSFDSLAGAQRYNLYAGRVSSLRSGGVYDHGAGAPSGPFCDATTASAGGGRLEITMAPGAVPSGTAYFLITAHVDDVESPSGHASNASEIDRSQSTCR